MKNRKLILKIIITIILIGGLLHIFKIHTGHIAKKDAQPTTPNAIRYYTCGMHPSVRVSPKEYKKGNVNCPICNMRLAPVYTEVPKTQMPEPTGLDYYGCGMEGREHVFQIKEIRKGMKCPICGMALKKLSKQEAEELKGVASRVKIRGEEARLAGVRTEPVEKRRLYKEIRTVGRIAYDPQLAIAEDEFLSALNTLDKIEKSTISEVRQRAHNLVESAERKLKLLGLSAEQIEDLRNTRKVHTSLILPEKKVWIYGDVYEYELSWIKVGQEVDVIVSSFPGEVFKGVISSINPVLDPKTRSVRFRAEIENPGLKLKPEMYVDVIIKAVYMPSRDEHEVLAIPKDAVLDTGTRKIVWIDVGNGEYEGREIVVGPEADSIINGTRRKFYPVLGGVVEGEMVVTKANFLIDSQSQITGVVAAAYGGALGTEEKKVPSVHQH